MSSLENQQQRVSTNRDSTRKNVPRKRNPPPTSKKEHPAKKSGRCVEFNGNEMTVGGLKAAQHGTVFQLDLLTLALYRANHLQGYKDFGLATEIPDAEKFDDIVFVTEKEGRLEARLVQAKHSEGKIKDISHVDLLSKNSKDPFGMLKYFESYLTIEKNRKNDKSKLHKWKIQEVMIVTNRGIADDLQEHVKGAIMEDDDFLYVAGHEKARKYCFQKSQKGQFYDDLTKKFIERYNIIESQKDKDKRNEDAQSAVDEFFKKFRLVANYPNRTELEKILEEELKEKYKILDSRAKLDILRMEMYEWLSNQKAVDHTYQSASDLFTEIEKKFSSYEVHGITKSNLESIPDNYHFHNDDLLEQLEQFLNSERILLTLEFDTLSMGRMRTAQIFKQLKQLENDERRSENLKSYIHQFGYIFINSKQSQNQVFFEYLKERMQDKVKWNLIIIELDDIKEDLYSPVIEESKTLNKKVILITSKQRKIVLSSQVQENIRKMETKLEFETNCTGN